jgi:hypothetical protein
MVHTTLGPINSRIAYADVKEDTEQFYFDVAEE